MSKCPLLSGKYLQTLTKGFALLCSSITTMAQVRTPAILTEETFLIVLALNLVILVRQKAKGKTAKGWRAYVVEPFVSILKI